MCIISYTLEQEQVNWLPMAPTDTEIVSRGDSFNCSSHDKKIFSVTPFKWKNKNFLLRNDPHYRKEIQALNLRSLSCTTPISIPAPAQGYELDQSFCAGTQLNNQVLE